MRDSAMAETLRRLAIEAGAAIMDVYGSADMGVETKGDDSPVTRADLAADAIICAGLAAAYPDIAIVTEERAESHALGADAPHFLVDPLDGTKEFIQRRGEFTVNIALIESGVPVAGVVYAPALERMFATTPDGGAAQEYLGHGPAAPMAAAVADNAALRVVASKSHRDAATDAWIARYPVAAFASAGSSLKFCLIAAGEADLYPRIGRTMEWDTAAGHAVLIAAGGRVLRRDDLTPLRYGKPGRDNPHFIAAGPGVTLKPE
ncbi:3'(2'),5'-bisphosphate nucleotidase [bacterium CG17_big_fil_post_rev_8_21_14_2_50_64_8]|nr:MAG: 3'(2'),5'-bisphosphate nucleotidase [bacterium CG17_big_fil_post_rev_8_21_14_2_50_64_8]PIY73618.1 MAG: 3'(2'),5'-bisphosphate nucleotidase [Rhodobacterales bacterium CG_4_10_14_0_8_um_filter_70_9]